MKGVIMLVLAMVLLSQVVLAVPPAGNHQWKRFANGAYYDKSTLFGERGTFWSVLVWVDGKGAFPVYLMNYGQISPPPNDWFFQTGGAFDSNRMTPVPPGSLAHKLLKAIQK